MNNIGRGIYGEKLAADYLKKHGYTILERNYKVPCGEIDIIASKNKCISFIEVKSRWTLANGMPSEAVNLARQRRYINAADSYIATLGYPDVDYRFDVIEIVGDKDINLIEDAFRE